MSTAPTIADVTRHLLQLRATLAHALKQPKIGPKRFNEIREQLLPLDEQLRKLGVEVEPTPQMGAEYVRLSRHERRRRNRDSKHSTYESRLMQRFQERDE